MKPRDIPDDKKYISLREAAELLETDEPEVRQLIEDGQLHAFRIGGEYLRLQKDQVSEVKARWRINRELFPEENEKKHILVVDKPHAVERLRDYLYFNDFYIVSAFVIAALVYLIFASQ